MSKTTHANVIHQQEAVATAAAADARHYTEYVNMPVSTNPYDRNGHPKVLFQLEGLELFTYEEVSGKWVFSLKGVAQRDRNWFEALNELGYKDLSSPERDELSVKLSAVLFQYDIVKVLATHVKAIG